MKEKQYDIEKAGVYLSCDDEFSTEEMVKAIVKAHKTKPMELIDYVNGVCVWEKLEFALSCEEFLDLIEIV